MDTQEISNSKPNADTYGKVIALTGTIGSGKTTVAEILADLGASVISADELAREAVAKGSEGLEQIVKEFGEQILLPSGELDRKKLSSEVFRDFGKKLKLEEITHPIIRSLALEKMKAALENTKGPVIYEVPLLFETGLNNLGFRSIITVFAEDEICIERVTKRDGISKEEAKARLESQLPSEIKKSKADFVIDNSSSLEALREKTAEIFGELTANN